MEPNEALEEAIGKALGSALYGSVSALITAGESPSAALRLASFAVLEGAFGREVWQKLGFPESTARRWRREVKTAVSRESFVEDPPVSVFNDLLDLQGSKFRVQLREED